MAFCFAKLLLMNRSFASLSYSSNTETLCFVHQSRDRTTSLVKQRFFWPGIDSYIRDRVEQCDRCIRRKTYRIKPQNLSALPPSLQWKSFAWTTSPSNAQREGSRTSWSLPTIFHDTPRHSPPGIRQFEQRPMCCLRTSWFTMDFPPECKVIRVRRSSLT